jgi:hypothetical protein
MRPGGNALTAQGQTGWSTQGKDHDTSSKGRFVVYFAHLSPRTLFDAADKAGAFFTNMHSQETFHGHRNHFH